ncbi:crotonobetainyl-CoA:carnitine CoA-transferase CaiB-like acyl-CoA transferase [Blastococcus colisei]|uniref:Crotonobetainyl-CoA:carnitine CoA-transferase CaiB-like acyl-CoA transferase n=1 Tax=Blastococcus colisei TaxID=1564162 RepID=A0A543P1S5_9ACTN|nr:CaiB/BaiF CoA-transferase family protein [Blastococcus colisei]TQN38029.1 crotonobetainyl-CoA:carnitine CoA-transferase CaiB-like acyl-CoA transferase [Blastococcus colisei]
MNLLDGVRVLDLTNVLAGPFAGYQLALMGADVVKVEVPGSGDLARNLGADPELSARNLGVSFLAQNAAKRSVTVNLKHPRGQEVFRRLVASADVLLENFRPGVLERLGFGWDELRALQPGLVYCAVSGFGQTGPMRDLPAYDQIVQGLSGVMSTTGTPGTAPLRTGFPVCDTLGGFAAAFAVAAALVRRGRTGEGCYLDVSMLETALVAMGWVVSDYVIAGQEPVPMGNENKTAAPSGTFRTADGRLNIAANKQEQFEALLRVLGREELLADPRFAVREQRKLHREELRTALEETLVERGAEEWVARLAGTGVPAAAVLTVPQALGLDQVRDRGLLHEVRVEETAVRVLGSSVHVDGAAVGPTAPPPLLGEHTRAELGRLGFDDDEIDELYAEGAL